jgi:amidase
MEAPLHWLSLLEVSKRLASKVVSSVELTEHMLARIERIDPVIRGYARVTAERAMSAARRADAEIARGVLRSALHGVPLAVKDLCDTAGVVSAAGMPLRGDHRPDTDATVVQRLEAAGAVLLGKLAMTEGASAAHHPDIPHPRNPWNLDRWAGASSSGSGAATAAGLCFASLGSDTAGSIRYPSAACGLAGIKPTYGRVSRAGIFPLAATLDHVGPMARSAADAGAVLQVIAGRDAGDPTTSNREVGDYLSGDEHSLAGVRLGIDEGYATGTFDTSIGAALERSKAALEDAGAKVVPVSIPPLVDVLQAHAVIFHAEVARTHMDLGLFPARSDAYGAHLRGVIEIGLGLSAAEYARAEECRLGFRGDMSALMENVDLILCPSSIGPPPPHRFVEPPPTNDFREMGQIMRFTAPFNLSGSPTITLRSDFDSGGLPVAVQLVSRDFEEALLIRAGRAHENRTPANNRVPKDPS